MPSPTQESIPFFIVDKQTQKKSVGPDWFKLFKLFILPLITLAIFVGVLIFLTLPKLGDIFANLDAISISMEQISKLDQDVIDLTALRQTSLQTTADLEALNTAVPTGNSQVADFQSRVIALAQQNSLEVSDAVIGEQILNANVGDVGARENLALVEIPATFTLLGSKATLTKFIDDVLKLEDFVIIGEMRLSIVNQLSVSEDLWTLRINFLKYQFPTPDDENQLIATYSSVPATSDADPVILDLIRN
jgi:hypothetical protein